jgi:hypothetical protein
MLELYNAYALLRKLRSGRVLSPPPIVDTGEVGGMPWRPAAKVPTSFDELRGGTRGRLKLHNFRSTPPRALPDSKRELQRAVADLYRWGAIMSKRNRTVFDEGNLEAMVRLREQDEKFCQALRAAIQRGRESRPTGVSTEPCTQRPILNYTRPD